MPFFENVDEAEIRRVFAEDTCLEDGVFSQLSDELAKHTEFSV